MSHNDYSDNEFDEVDDLEQKRLQKWEQIKHFTEYDYLSCVDTRQILETEWNQKFNVVEPQLENMFKDYLENVNKNSLDILSLADLVHMTDFIALIRHHIVREYDLSTFEHDPSLADPLVAKYDMITKQREEIRRKKLRESMKNANKTFNWSTKKYS